MTDPGDLLIWQTHEQAGCTDSHCIVGHARLAPAYPDSCSACGETFPDGEGDVQVLLTPLDGIVIEPGAVMAETRAYHGRCYPGFDAIEAMRAQAWPPAASLEGSAP